MSHLNSNYPHSAILAIKNSWKITPVWICSQKILLPRYVHVLEITSRNSLQGRLRHGCVLWELSWSLVLSIPQLPQNPLGERVEIIMLFGTVWIPIAKGKWNVGATNGGTLMLLGGSPLFTNVTKGALLTGLCKLYHEILTDSLCLRPFTGHALSSLNLTPFF